MPARTTLLQRLTLAAAVTATLQGCNARSATPAAASRGVASPDVASPSAVAIAHALPVAAPTAQRDTNETMFRFAAFGTVHVLHAGTAALAGSAPAHTIVFASGADGWNADVARIARTIAGSGDVLVLGVDARAYLRRVMAERGCAFPAGDVEALSQYAQHRLGLARYTPPVLVGQGAGAALAYATLAQAPRGTFPGAVALDLDAGFTSPKAFCGSSRRPTLGEPRGGGFALIADTALRSPVVILQPAGMDGTRSPAAVDGFAPRTAGGEVVRVATSARFEDGAAWLPAFTRALERIAPATAVAQHAVVGNVAQGVGDLPFVQIAPAAGARGPTDLVAVVLSGDGGWASIDREVGETLAAGGVPVVGLNALQYFWTPRNPDGAGADLARLVTYATSTPPGSGPARPRVLLVGYSRGADVLPFMARRLPPDVRSHVAGVALLGLEPSIAFEFHVSDWLGGNASNERPTLPEVAALRATLPATVPILCLYGTGEDDSACPAAARQSGARAIAMPGGHHLGGDYPALARQILAAVH